MLRAIKFWKTIPVLFCFILMLFCKAVFASVAAPNSESGNALFRALDIPLFSGFGHAGIYSYWQDWPTLDPQDEWQHLIIEATSDGVEYNFFHVFKQEQQYWGAYNNGSLTYIDRKRLIVVAESQQGAEYELWGWPDIKNPDGVDGAPPTFRCDGLVEYCYEQIGINGGTGFFTEEEERQSDPSHGFVFYPSALMSRMTQDFGTPPVITVKDFSGSTIADTDTTSSATSIKVKVSDGNNGSGLSLCEITKDGSPISGFPDTDDYLLEKEYSLTNLSDGTYNIKSYDQAGNVGEFTFTVDTSVDTVPPVIQFSGVYVFKNNWTLRA